MQLQARVLLIRKHWFVLLGFLLYAHVFLITDRSGVPCGLYHSQYKRFIFLFLFPCLILFPAKFACATRLLFSNKDTSSKGVKFNVLKIIVALTDRPH